MLTEYLHAALMRAKYRILDGEGFFANIPGFDGLYAQAETLEECRIELAAVLEAWLFLRIHKHLKIPKIGSIELKIKQVA